MKVCAVRTLATWLCFLSCALTGVATKPGLVVCIGLDGHLDLASLAEGCGDCDPSVLGVDNTIGTPGLTISPAACCPCLDLPLPPGQQATPRLFSKGPDLRLKAGIPAAPTRFVAMIAFAPAPSSSLPDDAPFSSLSQRRGVILRT